MIYPGEGFSVLRLTVIPSILVECGFTTNEYESQRLNISEFNKIEAWGIFRGLCRYFAAGVPEIKYISGTIIFTDADSAAFFSLLDSNGIDTSSVKVQLDSAETDSYSFYPETGILSNINGIGAGDHIIRIVCANLNGNHSFPFNQNIFINDVIKP
jgi:N-acetylmuramoyl-L-alanine amidase